MLKSVFPEGNTPALCEPISGSVESASPTMLILVEGVMAVALAVVEDAVGVNER